MSQYMHQDAMIGVRVKIGRSIYHAIGRDPRGIMLWKGASGPTIYVLIEKAQGEFGTGRFDDKPFAQPIAQQFSRLSSEIKRHVRAQQRDMRRPIRLSGGQFVGGEPETPLRNPGKVRENIFLFNNPGNVQKILAENFVKGANSGVASSMYIHGNRIYSYGPHFPIAERTTNVMRAAGYTASGKPYIIITSKKAPSKTTAGQIGLVKAAAQAAGIEVSYEELKPEAKGPAAYSNPGGGFFVMGSHTSAGWFPTRGEAENVAKQMNYRGGTHYTVTPAGSTGTTGRASRVQALTCHCGRRVELEGGDVECERCGQWYNSFGQKLKDPSQWEENPGVRKNANFLFKNPKGEVRENIFLFNNPGKLNTVETAAASVGLVVGTWAPGDGVTRYRFFLSDGKSSYGDYHQGDGLYTALGRKDAMAFISAYGKGRSARTNPRSAEGPMYVIEGFTPFARRGQSARRVGAFKTRFMKEARDRAEKIFRETGIVVAIAQENPLTRSEAAHLLRHAKADVTEAGVARRFGLTYEQKYAAGHARGIGFAVQETGTKDARRAWVAMHTTLDRVLRNPPVCPNPIIRGDKLPYHLQQEVLRKFIYRWTSDNTQRDYAWGKISGKPRIPLITDAQWLREHAFHVTKAGKLDLRHHHAEPGFMAKENPAAPRGNVTQIEIEATRFYKDGREALVDVVPLKQANQISVYLRTHDGMARWLKDFRGTSKATIVQAHAHATKLGRQYGVPVVSKIVLPNPLLQTIMMANPPISTQWDQMSGRQRLQLLGFIGFPEAMAGSYARYPWATLNASAKRGLERQWLDSTSETRGGTTRRRAMVGVSNPLTRREAAGVLREAKRDIRYGSGFRSGDFTRTVSAGQAFGKSKVVRKYGPKSANRAAARIADKTHKMVGTIFSNPGTLRLPKPGTKLTVSEALELARRIGDRGLIEQCQKALKLQKVSNRSSKCVIWKTFPMGSPDKIDSVVALTHYGDSPETMYQPPKGSKKGNHMYRHKWGEKGGKRSVPLLASADGKMLLMPLEGKKVASDWLRH